MDEKEFKKLLNRIEDLEDEVRISNDVSRFWATFAMVATSVMVIEILLHRNKQ